ncbi:MAG: ATP-binding cassette domain-containing protein [Lachnospiraceae bacterium]
MIEVKDIYKSYGSGKNRHEALKGIKLSFRENEFVAILGPSGSGKTTLLNVIGRLDHYYTGDLIVNNISTRGYSARDWDSYRNHSIGFIFQSYNLIQHVYLENTIKPLVERKLSGELQGFQDQVETISNSITAQVQNAIATSIMNGFSASVEHAGECLPYNFLHRS